MLKTIEVSDRIFTIEIDLEATKKELRSPYLAGHIVEEENPGYRIEFVGSGGRILQSTEGTSASFNLQHATGYVRARAIYCRKRSENHYERIIAWTQPLFLK